MKKLILAAALLAASIGTASAASVATDGASGTAPWPGPVFVRGGFNGWGTTDPMTYDPAEESYTAVVNIDAGDWEFKIADEGWANPDFGPTGNPVVTLGVASEIGTAIGANFMLSIVDSGDYLFTLFALTSPTRGGGPTSGLLTVERQVVPIPAAGLLLLSALGGLGFLRRRS